MIVFTKTQTNYLILTLIVILITGCGGRSSELDSTSNGNSNNTNTKPQSSTDTASSVLANQASSVVLVSSSSSSKSIASSSSLRSSSSSKISIDTTPPSMPGLFKADVVRSDRVALSWVASTDNGSGNVIYNIYRDHVQIDTLRAGDTAYFDFDVASNKPYVYSIAAGDLAGNWSALSEINVTTPNYSASSSQMSSSSAPASSLASSVASSSTSSVQSSLTNSSQASSLASSSQSSFSSAQSSSPQSSVSSSSSSKSSLADTTSPTAPAQVLAINALSTQVDISWAAATDDVGVTSYKIYRDSVLLKTVSASVLDFSDKTVSPDISYWYGVSAGDAAGNWSSQKLLSVKTPTVVTGGATLKWTPPTQRENGAALSASEIGGYEIRYRTVLENSYTYKKVDKSANQTIITGLSGDYIFEIAVFDSNNTYSDFVTIKAQ